MTVTTAPRTTAPRTTAPRRFWFAADAAVSAVVGVAHLAAAVPLADLLGADVATHRWVGAFLLGYAVVVGAYARSAMSPRLGWAVVAGNAVWVIASIEVAVMAMGGLEGAGRVWVVLQAVVVADLALLQARALRTR